MYFCSVTAEQSTGLENQGPCVRSSLGVVVCLFASESLLNRALVFKTKGRAFDPHWGLCCVFLLQSHC